jgi:REP element-mobilizing transposase RayT
MPEPILAYHVTFATYGFWLPNDPRGSNSESVRAAHLRRFGPATKVSDKRSHASDHHDTALRAAAKRSLKYAPVRFNGVQAREVGRGFARQVQTSRLKVFAAAILRCHVHLVIGHHRIRVEQIVNLMKGAASRQLLLSQLHPFQQITDDRPSPWGYGVRKRFLHNDREIEQVLRYVQSNPQKDGLPPQRWSFVSPYAVSSATTPSSSLSA